MTGPLALTQPPKLQFFLPGTTNPLVGGLIFTYAAGTMTKQNTYSNASATPNTNPIILDANGECVCFLDSTLQYDFWVSPSTDTDPPANPCPVFTGEPEAPTPASGDSSTNIATTAFVQQALTALLAGSPTTTTQAPGTLNTTIATTAFVGAEIGKAWTEVVLTNTGTWTVPGPSGGSLNIKYRVWGTGGGGGGQTSGTNAYGGGGGGGGYAEGIVSVGVGTVLTATFGSSGTAGSGSTAGGAGGNVTLTGGPSVVCGGGTGGAAGTSTNASSGGTGGGASGGQLNVTGGNGSIGTIFSQGFGGTPFGGTWGEGGSFPGQGGLGSSSGGPGGSGLIVLEYMAQ
jgi:hypothetical protein